MERVRPEDDTSKTGKTTEETQDIDDFEKNLNILSMKKEFMAVQEFESSCGEIKVYNVIVNVNVSLVDIFCGTETELNYEIVRFDKQFMPIEKIPKTKMMLINSRILDHQIFVFNEHGNIYPMGVLSDLEVHFTISKPQCFNFKGRDLFLRQEISLKEAFSKSSMEIYTIDGSIEQITLDSIPSPSNVIKVEGRGFIKDYNFQYKAGDKEPSRGDLYVTFFVNFPDYLEHEQKESIKNILGKYVEQPSAI